MQCPMLSYPCSLSCLFSFLPSLLLVVFCDDSLLVMRVLFLLRYEWNCTRHRRNVVGVASDMHPGLGPIPSAEYPATSAGSQNFFFCQPQCWCLCLHPSQAAWAPDLMHTRPFVNSPSLCFVYFSFLPTLTLTLDLILRYSFQTFTSTHPFLTTPIIQHRSTDSLKIYVGGLTLQQTHKTHLSLTHSVLYLSRPRELLYRITTYIFVCVYKRVHLLKVSCFCLSGESASEIRSLLLLLWNGL